jgi:hypothetical protein
MKFIRGMIYPNANNIFVGSTGGIAWRMKWAYEFWGFCVNGTSSPTIPGGFAPGGLSLPTNFTGGTTLMASGTDGSHPAVSGDLFSGDCIFTSASAPFTTDMVGKALVMWKPASTSSEDSIYLITRVINSTQIVININTGGTPNPTTKHPSMTSRSGVIFRVVDMVSGVDCRYMNGSFMVMQTEASTINPGQGNSQFALTHQWDTSTNATNFGNVNGALWAVGIGASGSWNGTTFTVQTTTGTAVSPIVVTTTAPHGFTTGQTVNIMGVAGNTNANGMFSITVTGATTFSLSGLAGVTGGGLYYGSALGTTTGNGNFGATIAAGSNGVVLPTGTINVNTTVGFDPSGTIFVTTSNGVQTVTYTSTNGSQFLGCTGGTGTMSTGGAVTRLGTVWNGWQSDGYASFFAANPNTNAAYSGGQTAVTIMADKTFFNLHCREQDLFQNNLQIHFHFEIPIRLYPQGQDLHPTAMLITTTNGLTTSSSTGSYGGGFVMRAHSSDFIGNRAHKTLVKALRGDGTPDVFGSNLNDYKVGYNTIAGTIPVSDGLLALTGIANQYSLARARLRTVKFTGTHVPKHHRIGLNGEFIQMQNGICWPWDNTIIPFQLISFGP